MTKKSQSKLLIGAVKRANPTTGKADASSGTPAKNVKKDDEVKPAPKALGALAGLGDYSSSEEDDDS